MCHIKYCDTIISSRFKNVITFDHICNIILQFRFYKSIQISTKRSIILSLNLPFLLMHKHDLKEQLSKSSFTHHHVHSNSHDRSTRDPGFWSFNFSMRAGLSESKKHLQKIKTTACVFTQAWHHRSVEIERHSEFWLWYEVKKILGPNQDRHFLCIFVQIHNNICS